MPSSRTSDSLAAGALFACAAVSLALGCSRRQAIAPSIAKESTPVVDAQAPAMLAPARDGLIVTPTARSPRVTAFGLTSGFACGLVDDKEVFCTERLFGARPARVEGLPAIDLLRVGHLFACGRAKADRTLHCWGIDHTGQLGRGKYEPARTDPLPPSPVLDAKGAPLVVEDFALGSSHACAFVTNGDILCWGNAEEVGVPPRHDARGNWIGVPKPRRVFREAIGLFAGSNTTCAVDAKQQLHCWGDQDGGYNGVSVALGPRHVTTPGPVRAMSFSSGHSCLLTPGAGVYCRGWNPGGELGSAGTRQAPMDGKGARHSDFRKEFTRVPELANMYAAIAASRHETCGLTENGDVECIGTPNWQVAQRANTATTLPEFRGAVAIAHGMGHRCAIDALGVLQCMGNEDGSPGLQRLIAKPTPIGLPPSPSPERGVDAR